jgi:enoyl-CoA hydratase/carnithine racemase
VATNAEQLVKVDLDIDGDSGAAVAVVRLDRPPMNALSTQVQDALLAVAQDLSRRSEVRAVVLHGGPKVFAAGADIKEMAAMDYAGMARRIRDLQAGIGAMALIPVPTIAAITGYALGGGLELALACDFRVAGDNARLGVPETQLGVIPGGGGTQRLARLLGPARAKELVFSGRHVKADEALAIGLVDRVVAPDDVLTEAMAWARQLAAGPTMAYRAAKAAIDQGLQVGLQEGLAIEAHVFAGLFATEDRTEGMRSFIDNGPGKATFQGR